MTSFRKEKLTSLLTRLISEHLLTHPLLPNVMVTVGCIVLSADFKNATVFVIVNPEGKGDEILSVIARKQGNIQKAIGSQLSLKFIPRLTFRLDEGEKNRARIDELLGKLR